MARFICKQCQKGFISYDLSNNKFCSHKCYWKSMKKTKISICEICGTEKKSSRAYRFCSRKCMAKMEKIERIGKGNPVYGKPAWNRGKPNTWSNGNKSNFYKNGECSINRGERRSFMDSLEYKNWRRQVFIRDNYECQICGCLGGDLRSNHIKRYVDSPQLRTELSNGITICKNCDLKWVLNREKNWESYFNFNLNNRTQKIFRNGGLDY